MRGVFVDGDVPVDTPVLLRQSLVPSSLPEPHQRATPESHSTQKAYDTLLVQDQLTPVAIPSSSL